MAVSQKETTGKATGRSYHAAASLPLQLDALTLTVRTLLDKAYDMLVDAPHDTSSAMHHLQFGLHEVKSRCSADEWERVVGECGSHRIGRLMLQDPFTRHSYEKPGGYAGDARLLDYLYGVAPVPAGTTPLGASVFGHWMMQQAAFGVRARGEVLAKMIDETAETFQHPRILSIACGHLREGTASAALMDGRVGELVALDQDSESLAEVERVYAAAPVRTMQCSVRAILSGKVKLKGFHFVYAAGLYDYLSERVAQRLTRLMFDMLAPGGRLLVANFATGLPEAAYMESFMDWTLIYRTPEQMAQMSADIASDEWKSHRVFWDASESILFLEVEKRAADNVRRMAVSVPGMDRVSFGPAVRERQPASPADV